MEGGKGTDVVDRDSVMLAVCWDAGVARVGGVRARVIDKV